MKHGDFSKLSDFYAQYRPGYSGTVLKAVLNLTGKSAGDLVCADIGAGTGIWTRQVADAGCRVTAVEPNDEMRAHGVEQSRAYDIRWLKGSGEQTGCEDDCYDIVSMASSFHWTDFSKAVSEFDRILKKNGLFVALWNPRLIERNPMLVDIESYLKELAPNMKRVSSGNSVFCDELFFRLKGTGVFDDVLYIEGTHVERQSRERYLGLWRSVNDVRVQAGEERFARFLEYVENKLETVDHVEATYKTRAWIALK